MCKFCLYVKDIGLWLRGYNQLLVRVQFFSYVIVGYFWVLVYSASYLICSVSSIYYAVSELC